MSYEVKQITLFHPHWHSETETLRVVICDGEGMHLIVSEPCKSTTEAERISNTLNEMANRHLKPVIEAGIDARLKALTGRN